MKPIKPKPVEKLKPGQFLYHDPEPSHWEEFPELLEKAKAKRASSEPKPMKERTGVWLRMVLYGRVGTVLLVLCLGALLLGWLYVGLGFGALYLVYVWQAWVLCRRTIPNDDKSN